VLWIEDRAPIDGARIRVSRRLNRWRSAPFFETDFEIPNRRLNKLNKFFISDRLILTK